MLGTLDTENKKNWKQYVAPLMHVYNCIKYENTGYPPYLLMFDRETRNLVDIAYGLNKVHKMLKSLERNRSVTLT